ncbi:sodium:solute symporter family protein [Paenarthrobacter sp. NPDC089322]|uniref:sodium:solute symporter family protein n=1 Tax=Paenarthrobacter sp. NPDC089322 TaxID=3155065 RepID=UPI00342F3284
MNMVIGYGAILLFTVLVVVVMNRSRRSDSSMSEYATGGRSFNSFFGTMAFLNTWIAGTVFVAFAGLTASGGVIGFYSLSYSLLSVVLMFFLGTPVNKWGRIHDLRTQADLLGLRYNSRSVRVIAAIIGVLASIPWVVLGMQSLGLVFSTLSFGAVSPYLAVVIGVLFIAARQIWTVRLGTRGLIISDMVQGLFAYGAGFLLILGLLVWLFTNGHGFGDIPPALLLLPGPDSPAGPLYLFSLMFTGMMGAWCWPDLFVRMFSVKTPRTVQKSAVQAAPIMFLFSGALTTVCLLAASMPGVAEAPDTVWFTLAGVGGAVTVAVAGVCVVAATMGNVGANLQAVGTQVVNDVIGVRGNGRVESAKGAKIAVAVITLVSAGAALLMANQVSGLIVIAFVSYQAVCQLAPTLLLGIFWRRGTAAAANASMITGILTAAVLELMYPSPLSIPWLGGLTSGVAGLIVNLAVYLLVSLAKPAPRAEQQRVNALFDDLNNKETAELARQAG